MKNKTIKEPTKGEIDVFVDNQLCDMEAFGYASKQDLIEGIMALLKRQHEYAISTMEYPECVGCGKPINTSYCEKCREDLSN